jgi:hypothetical protein
LFKQQQANTTSLAQTTAEVTPIEYHEQNKEKAKVYVRKEHQPAKGISEGHTLERRSGTGRV